MLERTVRNGRRAGDQLKKQKFMCCPESWPFLGREKEGQREGVLGRENPLGMHLAGLYGNLHFWKMWDITERTLPIMTKRLRGGALIRLQSKDGSRYVVGLG